jgi:nucleotidyltransferase/DNA polymerase involved in DNA repair
MPTDKALSKPASCKAFYKVPGVGPAIAEVLWRLGIWQIRDLQVQDPQSLYTRLWIIQNTQIVRCMLYFLRSVVYYALEPEPGPGKLK